MNGPNAGYCGVKLGMALTRRKWKQHGRGRKLELNRVAELQFPEGLAEEKRVETCADFQKTRWPFTMVLKASCTRHVQQAGPRISCYPCPVPRLD